MNKHQIASFTLRAPGLPSYPTSDCTQDKPRKGRLIEIVSLNYDNLPMELEAPKTFWVDLKSPPPKDLMVGNPVKLHLAPNCGLSTTFSPDSVWNSVFSVADIIGSRVILNPYKGSTWIPTLHNSCGWGYDMNRVNVRPAMQYSKYGYGSTISFLEYQPQYYSSRATQLEAVQLEEDYYRGRRHIPGW